ncbi:MAG: hypothetical protein Q4G70_02685 [Pseudomonadota bacterium]|nr:hypothetical protein [Pseudomonadota bacterium]
MAQLHIDTHANSVQLADGCCVRFSRRWETAVLAALLGAGSQGLTAADLQQRLAARGQAQPLNRAQCQRLFGNLRAFCQAHPVLGWRVESAPRQWTVGPWHLRCDRAVRATVDGQHVMAAPSAQDWPHAALTRVPGHASLLPVLTHLLLADAFAIDGQWLEVLDALQPLNGCALTPEGHALVQLRAATAHRRMGDYSQAEALLRHVAGSALPATPGLPLHASFLLQRVQYDRAPAQTHASLWQTTRQPPLHGVPDQHTLAEWHNLRALLARRRIQALLEQDPAAAEAPALHELALRHYQAAMHQALSQGDVTRLQAYVANLAFHLQTWGRLTGWAGDTTTGDVLRWQRLTMAYTDKFDAGRDTAWEYIFFAEFWLDNPQDLGQLDAKGQAALECVGLLPDDERFYKAATRRLRAIADPRQLAIMLVLYLRFVREHQHAGTRAQQRIGAELQQLLRQQPPGFADTLAAEGYGPWLPVARKGKKAPDPDPGADGE